MNIDNDISHDETFKKLNDRNVKDLYWLLFSKCPINNNHPELEQIPFFPEHILEEWKQGSKKYFLELEQKPNEFHQFLKRPKNKRLGFYAEALLSYFFQTFHKIELLLQNFQIIEDKKTLGELDFIIKWKNRVLHIECAVKFYLCDHSKEANNLNSWVGPSCKDDLGRKMKKVKEHQLPIINSLKQGDRLNFAEVESYLFLKGKLFVNQEVSCGWVNNELLGEYFYLDNVSDVYSLSLATKPFWMSIHTENSLSENAINFNGNKIIKRAELVEKTGMQPFFVAPQNWPF